MAFAITSAGDTVESLVSPHSVVRAIPLSEDEWQHQQLLRSLLS
jgi:hypothetical protein